MLSLHWSQYLRPSEPPQPIFSSSLARSMSQRQGVPETGGMPGGFYRTTRLPAATVSTVSRFSTHKAREGLNCMRRQLHEAPGVYPWLSLWTRSRMA